MHDRVPLSCLLLLSLIHPAILDPYYVKTIIGSGPPDFYGDGGPATDCSLNYPWDVACTTTGDLYISDTYNTRIRKVSGRNGTIDTYAGNGIAGSTNGASAAQSSLAGPAGLWLVEDIPPAFCQLHPQSWLCGMRPPASPDAPLLCFSDSFNYHVRCVLPNATVVTVAGTDTAGPMLENVPAVQAFVVDVEDVALDLENAVLLLAVTGHNVIRTVDLSGPLASNQIATYAGTGHYGMGQLAEGPALTVMLSAPTGVTFNADYVFIADHDSSAVRVVTRATQYLQTLYRFPIPGRPFAVHLPDQATLNQIYVVSAEGSCVYLITNPTPPMLPLPVNVSAVNRVVGRFANPGDTGKNLKPREAQLHGPRGMCTSYDGILYVADTTNDRIVQAVGDVLFATVVGMSGMGHYSGSISAVDALFHSSRCVVRDSQGTLYIADKDNDLVRAVDPDDFSLYTVVGHWDDFGFNGLTGNPTDIWLDFPTALAIWQRPSDGREFLFIADSDNGLIRQVDLTANVLTTLTGVAATNATYHTCGSQTLPNQVCAPQGLCVSAQGLLVVADTSNNRLVALNVAQQQQQLDPTGTGNMVTLTGHGKPGVCNGSMRAVDCLITLPYNCAFDAHDVLYFAEWGNHMVRRLNPVTGFLDIIAGTGVAGYAGDGGPASASTLSHPTAVTLDAVGGLYIADGGNNVIRYVDPSGIISTIAGTGASGLSGDGGAATAATFNYPSFVLLQPDGSVLLADDDNNRIRMLYRPSAGPASNNQLSAALGIGGTAFVLAAIVWRWRRKTVYDHLLEEQAWRDLKEIDPADVQLLGPTLGDGVTSEVKLALFRGAEIAVKIPKGARFVRSGGPPRAGRPPAVAATDRPVSEYPDAIVHATRTEVETLLDVGVHPRLVQYLGCCITQTCLMILMDLHAGGSVERKLITTQAFKLSLASDHDTLRNLQIILRFLVDASSAVQQLHSQHMLHRDIAARNFLVGAENHVVICDFGSARRVDLPASADRSNASSIAARPPMSSSVPCVRGTPGELRAFPWLAPECFPTDETLALVDTTASEVWSFACFMYEVFARERPYDGMHAEETVQYITKGPRLEVPPSTPTELAQLMRRCWDLNPRQRPSMEDVNIVLRGYAAKINDANAGEALYQPLGEHASWSSRPRTRVSMDLTGGVHRDYAQVPSSSRSYAPPTATNGGGLRPAGLELKTMSRPQDYDYQVIRDQPT